MRLKSTVVSENPHISCILVGLIGVLVGLMTFNPVSLAAVSMFGEHLLLKKISTEIFLYAVALKSIWKRVCTLCVLLFSNF